jgi:hypothetical protein
VQRTGERKGLCLSQRRKERREERKTGKIAENEIGKIVVDTAVPAVGRAG